MSLNYLHIPIQDSVFYRIKADDVLTQMALKDQASINLFWLTWPGTLAEKVLELRDVGNRTYLELKEHFRDCFESVNMVFDGHRIGDRITTLKPAEFCRWALDFVALEELPMCQRGRAILVKREVKHEELLGAGGRAIDRQLTVILREHLAYAAEHRTRKETV